MSTNLSAGSRVDEESNEDMAVSASAWDANPGSRGHRAPRAKLDDEVSPMVAMTQAGLDEADREQRIAADDDLPRNEDEV